MLWPSLELALIFLDFFSSEHKRTLAKGLTVIPKLLRIYFGMQNPFKTSLKNSI